ncbi:putative methyltransferase [Methylophaga aminisulfidivorans MP]|uniref:Putative methyltransferase n=1 Tax=Methylophaga aminisulfidivorans MP TaxID=1026882 RepID=F5SZF9_9GAMM|nr:class I SAM-dependent methyltransferase [Methylophaga aminisulfidivorans]EGL54717.1 putative methyltransferase [Methylophaga aminisulfidivorans MP]
MLRETCRVCHQDFYPTPLLVYENMPKSAQFFPVKDELSQEYGSNLSVNQCRGCGLVQLSNPPVDYYREVIRAVGISNEMRAFRQEQFSDWVNRYNLNHKRVLEIGCGQGEYLALLNELDIDAYGIEFGEKSVSVCRQMQLNVEKAYIDSVDSKLSDGPFDAFVMLNFLEHLPDPVSTLLGIAENLKKDGIGLIEVPNFDMILRESLFTEFISDHLFYFTSDTFVSTLNLSGFDVLKCEETWHDYSLSAVVRKRNTFDLSVFDSHRTELKKSLYSYIEKFPMKSVVVWGAGHQSLAVLSLTELADKIKYVVDSAPFKQNKFTPATHIPVVSPDNLTKEPIEAVIVMAASYTGEVVNIIKERYPNVKEIAILKGSGLEFAGI